MRILEQQKYLRLLPNEQDKFDTSRYLGIKQKKNDVWYTVENNLVNRIVLGLPIHPDHECNSLKSTVGLKDYQIEDVVKMLRLDRVLNANPMGLGKTIEAIRYLEELNCNTVCIVTPKIIMHQWVKKIKQWWGRDAFIFESTDTPKIGEVWLVNYDKLRNEITNQKFRSVLWDAVILDEAHKIKNRNSQTAKAVKSLPAIRRVAMTGTPILRYVDDLWSILHFLDVQYSGISYWNFVNYFCNIEQTFFGNRITGLVQDPQKIEILNKLLAFVSVRNEGIEVAHGKSLELVQLPMCPAQKQLYRKEKQLLLNDLPANCTIANGAVLTTRLRQTTSWPGLFIADIPGPKFEWILETCQNHPDEKFVIFSAFSTVINGLIKYLHTNGITATDITGGNSGPVNQEHKQLFLGPNIQVLAGTIGAMGQGFDELQEVCRLMICIDRDWSPEIMHQAEERLHRLGQKYPVTVYYLECEHSFDQYVGKVNSIKAMDIREALKND